MFPCVNLTTVYGGLAGIRKSLNRRERSQKFNKGFNPKHAAILNCDKEKCCVCFCAADIERIAHYILRGPGRHETFNRLALLSDKFGHRMVGSKTLEDTIGE